MSVYPDYLAFDVECSGATNGTFGNPFCDSNRLVVIGYGNVAGVDTRFVGDDRDSHVEKLRDFKESIQSVDLTVGFNWKFDAHWSRRYGILLGSKNTWDCQLAHFIIHDQQQPLPSLEDCASYYGLENKYIDIETEYWKKGIDNDQVPHDILERRVTGDVRITSQLFELQIDYLRRHPSKKRLIWVSCQDQKCLAEMEWNGLKYDLQRSIEAGDKIRLQQKEIEAKLDDIVQVDRGIINWNSKDHLSAILFGGDIPCRYREEYLFTYKDGSTATKSRWSERKITRERRLEPIDGTEYSKGGVYSTDAQTISRLKPRDPETKKILTHIKEYRKLDKKVGTYYHGLPKLYKEMGWTNSVIHGQLQSAVTATGRLSSKGPNQQNMDHDIRQCIVSRFQ